jgi:hypothetical protein
MMIAFVYRIHDRQSVVFGNHKIESWSESTINKELYFTIGAKLIEKDNFIIKL